MTEARAAGEWAVANQVGTQASTATSAAATRSRAATDSNGWQGTERRLVSVLFCDLVGFTTLSERRDPEEVRELLSGYFDLAKSIVSRYGGVVEKFIGDAVMALWGAPVANEDDAERAVRAGLDLVGAVQEYGAAHASGGLSCRVGIVTGEVATTAKEGEGLVIGDRVNTAARVQSVASPGTVYVDEETRHVTSAAIAYVDRGEKELKGKSAPTRVFEATRVTGTIAGLQRVGGIDAPFVGRDTEFRLLKELFHTNTERNLARLVLVSGVAGIGKSRLSWEFLKYIDGLAGVVLWHSGRCLAYGEGVSYWALAEMVRSRLQIGEDDPPELVAERLRAGLERWIEDPSDRELIGPRLGQLLGQSPERQFSREELFSGWRLFFERLSEHLPVVMVIEDLQWADPGLLDFLDHLLEWSGGHAIFLLVLSRPEGTEERGLRLSRRNVTSIPLDRLADETMGELLDGLVMDLPAEARARIVERAEGIPLYGIETVRALLDKGRLARREDGRFELVSELGALDTPPGLTALIASRLDALSEGERRLVRHCAVLGASFSKQAVGAVSGLGGDDLDRLLSALVRKEVLLVRADRFSPEIGQYHFTQSLIRSVAHDMLSLAERKTGHLAAAAHLKAAFPEEGAEVSEVIASHLHDAYRAAGSEDADELRVLARAAHRRAGERAQSVGSPEVAESSYLKAADLADDELEKAELLEKAANAASRGGWSERAVLNFEAAATAHREAGRTVEAARATASLGRVLRASGQIDDAAARLQEALSWLDGDSPPDVVAALHLGLGQANMQSHDYAGVDPEHHMERALILAQQHDLDLLPTVLNSRGVELAVVGRDEEARLYYEGATSAAERHGDVVTQNLARGNLGDLAMTRDLPGAELHCREAVALARSIGDRRGESFGASNLMYVLMMAGRFEEERELGRELFLSGGEDRPFAEYIHEALGQLEAICGNREIAEAHLGACGGWAASEDPQSRAIYRALAGAVSLAREDLAAAREESLKVLEAGTVSARHQVTRDAFPVAVEACLREGDLEAATAVIDRLAGLPSGEVPPYLRAQILRGRALVGDAGADGTGAATPETADGLAAAEQLFESMQYPYWAARTRLERAEVLARAGQPDEARRLAEDAERVFESLGAAPMLARARLLLEASPAPVA